MSKTAFLREEGEVRLLKKLNSPVPRTASAPYKSYAIIDTARHKGTPGHQTTLPSEMDDCLSPYAQRINPVAVQGEDCGKGVLSVSRNMGVDELLTCGSVPNLDAIHTRGSSGRRKLHARNVDDSCHSENELLIAYDRNGIVSVPNFTSEKEVLTSTTTLASSEDSCQVPICHLKEPDVDA